MTPKKGTPLIFLFAFSLCLSNVFGNFFVYKKTARDTALEEIYSSYSGLIPKDGLWAYIQTTEPQHACSEVKSVPVLDESESHLQWFAILASETEEECALEEKINNLKKAGFHGLIHHWRSPSVKKGLQGLLQFDLGKVKTTGDFPVIWILPDDAKRVQSSYTYEKEVLAFIPAPTPGDDKDPDQDSPSNDDEVKVRPVLILVIIAVAVVLTAIVGFVCLKTKK